MKRVVLLLGILGMLGGCEMFGCTLELRWGLSIGVTGADTGQPVAAMVVIRDGDYVEELMPLGDRYLGADERAGTYRIDIFAAGYTTRTIDGVEVDEDGCHVDTRTIDVVLQRP